MDTSHIFWAIEIQFFMSSHDWHYIFPPHPLVQKTLSMYIANRIAKDQYVQPNVPTTTILTVKKNNFNHDTGPHVYDTPDNNDKLVLRILLQDGTLIIEVSAFLKWIFNFQQTNKKNVFVSISGQETTSCWRHTKSSKCSSTCLLSYWSIKVLVTTKCASN